MKRIINGKKYDTETATMIHEWDNGHYTGDFEHCEEALYRTRKGAYFLAGSGGPMSKYAESRGNETSGGEAITPITETEAREWLEEHDGADEIEATFGEVDEADADELVMIAVPRKVRDRLREECGKTGEKMGPLVARLIEEHLSNA